MHIINRRQKKKHFNWFIVTYLCILNLRENDGLIGESSQINIRRLFASSGNFTFQLKKSNTPQREGLMNRVSYDIDAYCLAKCPH